MQLVFDLDGVLRDLYKYLCRVYGASVPDDYSFEHNGISLFDIIRQDNYKALIGASPTEYLKIVKRYVAVPEIWTSQPDDWIPYTLEWLRKALGKFDVKFMDTEEKRKKLDRDNGYLLVEDCPLFKNYNRIVLIDRPYNRGIRNVQRVSSPQELEAFFAPVGRII